MKSFKICSENLSDQTVGILSWEEKISEADFLVQLSKSDQVYLDSMTNPERRIQTLASRYLLKELFNCVPEKRADGSLMSNIGAVSVAHSQGIAVAVCAKKKSVGIDVENIERFDARIQRKICTEDELDMFPGLALNEKLALIFSAKEALFKAHFSLGQKNFYFHDVKIRNVKDQQIEFENLTQTGPTFPIGYLTTVYFRRIEKYLISVCAIF